MDANVIMQAISTVGFPITCSIVLFFGCKYMLDNQQKNTDRMLSMFEQANRENREAIDNNTQVLQALKERLDKM